MTTAPVDDAALLARFARAGDEAAFTELVRRHGPMVVGVCRRILHGPSDADDAAQGVFLTLARKATTMLSHPDLAGWLHRCATNIARRQRDAERTRRARERAAPPPATPGDPDVARSLDAAIAALPAGERDALVLHHLEGRTQAEIARATGVPPGTVAWRLHRARERLAALLARRGIAAPGVVAAIAAARAGADEVVPALAGAAAAAGAVREGAAPDGAARAWRWAREAARPARPRAAAALAASLAIVVGAAFTVARWPAPREPAPVAAVAAARHRDLAPTADAAADAAADLDAAECYRRAIAALPPPIGDERRRSEDERVGRVSEDARNIVAQAPEALRWWRRGADLGAYHPHPAGDWPMTAGGLGDPVLLGLGRVVAAACAALGDAMDADAPDAIAQADALVRAGAGMRSVGNDPWVFDYGTSIQWALTTTLGVHVGSIPPRRAAAWLEAMAAWPDVDIAAAADGIVADAREDLRLLLRTRGAVVAALAHELGTVRAQRVMTPQADGEFAAAFEAEGAGEPGAVMATLQAHLDDLDRDVAARRDEDERRAVALILDLAGATARPEEARTVAEALVAERGEALFAPWLEAIARTSAEDLAALRDHPPADAVAAPRAERWEALAERVPIAAFMSGPSYAYAERLRGRFAIARAAFTARATGMDLAAVGASWPPPYGPLLVGADGMVTSARVCEKQPLWLRVGDAPAARAAPAQ